MKRGLDFEKAEAALKRAAEVATHGTREERSGRFLPGDRGFDPEGNMTVRRHSVVIPRDGGGIEIRPLKEWLRRNPGKNPTGLDPDLNTSHQLRSALRRAGWSMEESASEVRMVSPSVRTYSEVGREFLVPDKTINDEVSGSQAAIDVTLDWFWEGNVVETLATHLSTAGWRIISKANTRAKERGVDIHAAKGDVNLFIEAKGYPSSSYRDPARSAETKRTNPSLQAQQWYSHAILKAMRLQTEYPQATVALAFPDFPRYRSLFKETESGLKKLSVAMFTIQKNGEVKIWGLDNGCVAEN